MVPNGFQHVIGLGNFPCDWLISSADEITEKITKGTTPPKSEIVEGSNIPFLRVNNLGFDRVLNSKSEILFVTKQAHSGFLSRSVAYPNDILMNIVGPPLGKIAMLDDQYPEYNMNQAVLIYRCKEKLIDHGYFLNFLGSELAQQWLQSRSKKTSGQQNLTIQVCKDLPTPVPPLPEQRKIAQILSTWDRGITATEKLINASKQQKKALMQQLLTGKKRLVDPETGKAFEGDWEEVRLDCVLKEFINGNAFSASNYKTTGIPIVTMGNISLDGSFNERPNKANFWEEKDELSKYIIRKGDLLIAMTDVTPDKNLIGRMTVVDIDKVFYLNQRVGLLRLMPNVSCTFIRYLSNELNWRKYSIAVSASGVQANMSTKDIKNGLMVLPSFKEQQKIASVLTAADKEIELLQTKLAHLKQEKKALMQQLLTGKRRVKVETLITEATC